jgi:hypothetical protein
VDPLFLFSTLLGRQSRESVGRPKAIQLSMYRRLQPKRDVADTKVQSSKLLSGHALESVKRSHVDESVRSAHDRLSVEGYRE